MYVNMSVWERRDPVSTAAAWRYSTTRIHGWDFIFIIIIIIIFIFSFVPDGLLER